MAFIANYISLMNQTLLQNKLKPIGWVNDIVVYCNDL